MVTVPVVVDIVVVVGVVRVVVSHPLHVLSQPPRTSVSHKPLATIDWHNDSFKELDLPMHRSIVTVVVVTVEVVVVNVVEVLVLVLVVVVYVEVVVVKVVDVDVVLVVVSHPLHVLSHSPGTLEHNPWAKTVWHFDNDNLLRLFVQRRRFEDVVL